MTLFELSLKSRVLSVYELYASKICAALDRQHPRDLFDVHLLLKSDGLRPEIRKAFIVYLISHPGPMVEILCPQQKNMRDIFEKEFKSMVNEDIKIEDLETARNELIAILREDLTRDERRFILSNKIQVKHEHHKVFVVDLETGIPTKEKLILTWALDLQLKILKERRYKYQEEGTWHC